MEAHWSKALILRRCRLLSALCRSYPSISTASRTKEQLRSIGNVLAGSIGSSSDSQQKTSQQAESVNFQSPSLNGRRGALANILSSSVHLCLPAWTELCQMWLRRFSGKQQRQGYGEMKKLNSADSFLHARVTAWSWWNEAWRRFRRVGASWSKWS